MVWRNQALPHAYLNEKTPDGEYIESSEIKERETGFEPDLEHGLSDNESNTWEDI